MTQEDLQEINMTFNGKTYVDIPETAKYIQENNITIIDEYLLEESYTLGFIEEFFKQYPNFQHKIHSLHFLISLIDKAVFSEDFEGTLLVDANCTR